MDEGGPAGSLSVGLGQVADGAAVSLRRVEAATPWKGRCKQPTPFTIPWAEERALPPRVAAGVGLPIGIGTERPFRNEHFWTLGLASVSHRLTIRSSYDLPSFDSPLHGSAAASSAVCTTMEEARSAASRPQRAAAAVKQHDYIVGLALLILVVLLWTASNFLTNNILTSGWDKPFAVTYANTSSFALYLIPFALATHKPRRGSSTATRDTRTSDSDGKEDGASSFWAKIGFALPESPRQRRGSYTRLPTSGAVAYDGDTLRPPSPNGDALRDIRPRLAQGGRPSSIDGRRPVARLDEEGGATPGQVLPPLTLRETAVLAGQFTLVWFAANWSLTAALGMTSVASGTTLSSASGKSIHEKPV